MTPQTLFRDLFLSRLHRFRLELCNFRHAQRQAEWIMVTNKIITEIPALISTGASEANVQTFPIVSTSRTMKSSHL